MNYEPKTSILIFVGVVASFSLIAEIWALIFFYKNKSKFQSKSIRLIVALIMTDLVGTIADFGYFFTFLWQPVCIANGFLRQTSTLSSIMWIICMSHLIANALNFKQDKSRLYLLASVFIPSAIGFGILFGNITGLYQGFVWQVVACLPNAQTALIVEIPCIIMFLYLFYEYNVVRKLLMKIEMRKEAEKLMIYPISIFLLWFTSVPARLFQFFLPTDDNSGVLFFDILFVIGSKSFGLVNSIFFRLQNRDIDKKPVEIPRNESMEKYERQLSAETEVQLRNCML